MERSDSDIIEIQLSQFEQELGIEDYDPDSVGEGNDLPSGIIMIKQISNQSMESARQREA